MKRLRKQTSVDDENLLARGLKYVRWEYTARNRDELSVQNGDEVKIIRTGSTDAHYQVERLRDRRVGLIPGKCFYPRQIINVTHEAEFEDEISVDKDDIIGIIEKDSRRQMFKVLKDGSTGYIPEHCLYRQFEVHDDYEQKNSEELSLTKGEHAGQVEVVEDDIQWKVYFRGRIGLVPSRCFEPPAQVYWAYEAKRDDDITVSPGDTVTLVDHHHSSIDGRKPVRVRLGDKIGYIPKKCFEVPAQVYWANDGSVKGKGELIVKEGDIVGRVEITIDEKPPDGYIKARLNTEIGWIPTKCFEVPAKVVRNYKAAKPMELSVKKGEIVRVMDATASIQVRSGSAHGFVPFSHINADPKEIIRILNKQRDVYNPPSGDDGQQFMETEDHEEHYNVDEIALGSPLVMQHKKDAVYYLKDIENDKIAEIGIELGLAFSTLQSCNNENFRDEMVEAWLKEKDQVMDKTGAPTWKSLRSVLHKLSLAEAVESISKDNSRLVLSKLINLRTGSKKGGDLRIIEEVCSDWQKIGLLIGMPTAILQIIDRQHPLKCEQCFTEVVKYWISESGTEYPATWIGLRMVLADSQHSVLADKIKQAMPLLKL